MREPQRPQRGAARRKEGHQAGRGDGSTRIQLEPVQVRELVRDRVEVEIIECRCFGEGQVLERGGAVQCELINALAHLVLWAGF